VVDTEVYHSDTV